MGRQSGRRNLYVRADTQPLYSRKRKGKPSFAQLILIIVVVLALAGGGAYLIFGKGRGKLSLKTGSTESSSTASGSAKAAKKSAAAAQPTQKSEPAPAPKTRPIVSFAAVGDLCFMNSSHQSLGTAASLLSSMKSQLSAADVTLGNLEIALTSNGQAQDKTYTFRAPLTDAAGVAQAGFDVVSVANNHALDYGRTQLSPELDKLDQAGLTYVGGGLNKQEAWAVKSVKRNGATIGFLAFSEITPSNYAATDTDPGVAYTQDIGAMTAAVAAAKASKSYDYLLVIMHWGIEGDYQDNQRQSAEAHALIDAGADAVIGSHPHRIQGVEYYKNGLIAYSLGNFVFGTFKEPSCQTMLLNFQLTDAGPAAVTATPVYIDRGTPKVATGDQFNKIATIIKSSSAACGTPVSFDNGIASFNKK